MHISHANRGMALEHAVEQANAVYRHRQIATIQKVATPTKVLTDRRGGTRVVRTRSTVDFIGVWMGRPVAFDAKENRTETRWALSNVQPHQVEFLEAWQRSGGLAFLLIYHHPDATTYLMPFDRLAAHWQAWRDGGRASVPAAGLRTLPRVGPGRGAVVDYLATLEAHLQL